MEASLHNKEVFHYVQDLLLPQQAHFKASCLMPGCLVAFMQKLFLAELKMTWIKRSLFLYSIKCEKMSRYKICFSRTE